MTNISSQMPRCIKFNQNSIRNFVQGSSFLNSTSGVNQNYIQPKPQTALYQTQPNFNGVKKGFQFYNKNNLLLKTCNAEDIQYVHKNPLVYQQDIIVPAQRATSPRNKQNQQSQNMTKKAKTAANFYKPSQESNNQHKMSKQAQLNQFLFNYRKQQEDKKNKKLKFLAQMEQKLSNLEKQATQLASQKQLQYEQINGILKIHSEAAQNARKAELVGKLNSALHMAQVQPKQTTSPNPKKITENMELLQINLAIQQNHESNDALLDEIQRISRSKSRQRKVMNVKQKSQIGFQKTGMKKFDDKPQTSCMSKTLKRPMQAPPRPTSASKKLTNTWRDKK